MNCLTSFVFLLLLGSVQKWRTSPPEFFSGHRLQLYVYQQTYGAKVFARVIIDIVLFQWQSLSCDKENELSAAKELSTKNEPDFTLPELT